MYEYAIESVDADGTHYDEQNYCSFDLTTVLKKGDLIKGDNPRDIFGVDRIVHKITFKG